MTLLDTLRHLAFVLFLMVLIASRPFAAQAATFAVTKTADTNDGACDADCSVREAIAAANANAGADDVTVPAGTYALTIAGSLVITGDLALTGAGAGATTIDSSAVPFESVVEVSGATVTISALTLTGGNTAFGGGITNDGTLTVANAAITGNSGTSAGGIYNVGGSLTIEDSTIAGNTGTSGGGINNEGGTLTVSDSTFSNNTGNQGGGIHNSDGTTTVTDSTFSDNDATDGAGILNSSGTVTVSGSTFSGNSANGGGGIENFTHAGPGTVEVTNCTFSGNSATSGAGISNWASFDAVVNVSNTTIAGSTGGSGVFNYGSGATMTLTGTILADNAQYDCDTSFVGVSSGGHNLDTDGSCGFSGPGDLSNVPDAGLAPLANNGGPTQTHALLPGSPAIDAGTNASCPLLDQRGQGRRDGNADGVVVCDVGAYELQPALDAYKCYKARDLRNPPFVDVDALPLDDQFGPDTVQVKKPLFLCNPADSGAGINAPQSNICCYMIDGTNLDPARSVEIEDQFGTLQLKVKRPDLLCQPCSKTDL